MLAGVWRALAGDRRQVPHRFVPPALQSGGRRAAPKGLRANADEDVRGHGWLVAARHLVRTNAGESGRDLVYQEVTSRTRRDASGRLVSRETGGGQGTAVCTCVRASLTRFAPAPGRSAGAALAGV